MMRRATKRFRRPGHARVYVDMERSKENNDGKVSAFDRLQVMDRHTHILTHELEVRSTHVYRGISAEW